MPLSQFCVLEIGDLPAASYCARLLSDLGAAVIRLRGPEALAPSPDTLDGAWSGFLHFGKSCTPFDAAALPGLLAGADVCIDSRPPAARIGCDPRVLAPGLLHLDVGWFGRSGPYAGFAGGDAVCRALAGLVQLVGPAAGPPLAHPDHQAAIIGGLSGAIAVLGCLLGQQDGEAGRAVELSVHEACIALAEYQASEARIAWLAGCPAGCQPVHADLPARHLPGAGRLGRCHAHHPGAVAGVLPAAGAGRLGGRAGPDAGRRPPAACG